jgi:glutamyl-tRNA reductase
VVVSTTASDEPIVTFDQYSRILRARRYRHSLILDIAVPRDFDPKINALETVNLYSVDDLQAQANANRKGRLSGVETASAIVQEETAACADAIRHRHLAGSILRQLGDYSDAVRTRELDRLFASRPNLDDDDRKAIAQTLHRFQNQLLHHPRTALRSATGSADHAGRSLVDAVRHLFGLGTSTDGE